jgi:hypothetical protein
MVVSTFFPNLWLKLKPGHRSYLAYACIKHVDAADHKIYKLVAHVISPWTIGYVDFF